MDTEQVEAEEFFPDMDSIEKEFDDMPVEVLTIDENEVFIEWQEYRDYVRTLECVACQWNRKSVKKEILEQQLNLAPELAFLSDPHHVKSRGAGGPDAENIVPLCRYHHQQFHTMGSTGFQASYDLDLKEAAIKIFHYFHDNYLPTIIDQQNGNLEAKQIFAEHQRFLSRIHDINTRSTALGTDLVAFVSNKRAGRFAYEWLGFKTMIAYITAPHSSGGLNIKRRTGHRLQCMAQTKNLLGGDGDIVAKMGAYKTELAYPIIRAMDSPVERKEVAEQVSSMSLADVISWQGEKRGKRDLRTEKHRHTVELIQEFLSSLKIEVEVEAIEGLAWKIIGRGRMKSEGGGL